MPAGSAAAAHSGVKDSKDSTSADFDDDVELKEANWILPFQERVSQAYQSPPVQIGVAVLICVNFFVSAVNAQMLPENGSLEEGVFIIFEWTFGVLFFIELIWNIYGSWWRPFISSGWNWFDFIIVIISLLAHMIADMPGISVLRLFRAFRVFRLFKRIESLRTIIEGVMASLPGVMNAFLVLGILMGIWSIMGVEFFREDADNTFGNFLRAMLTMWQAMTMDSWASGDGMARELIFNPSGEHIIMGPIFFVSYIFIAGIVMTNVVVAILLEKYLDTTARIQEEKKMNKERQLQLTRENHIKSKQADDSDLDDVKTQELLTAVREAILDSRMRNYSKKKLARLVLRLCRDDSDEEDEEGEEDESPPFRHLLRKKAEEAPDILDWLSSAKRRGWKLKPTKQTLAQAPIAEETDLHRQVKQAWNPRRHSSCASSGIVLPTTIVMSVLNRERASGATGGANYEV